MAEADGFNYFLPQDDEPLTEQRLRDIFEQIQIRLDTRDTASDRTEGRTIRGRVTGTYIGGQAWVVTPDVPHGFGVTPKVIGGVAEFFELGDVNTSVQAYAVTSAKFAFIVTVGGASPAAGTTVNVNYIAWV